MNKNISLLLGIFLGLIFIFLGILDNQTMDKTKTNVVA